ncbi:MAG TPA: flavin-nucleotide-binding protein [Dehalococcoidia bacterium]|jgi:uncharacterized protein|nr:flavin-nucleotide-binding protein [Dehalococcoidia bacterium]|tara:strand:+ start:338 stop:805 length:468 start_codon:yes stop_codon:yes gene_type:complete
MGILTEDIKKMVRQQRMGFIATASQDGLPNLSPKGTMAVWNDDCLMFADLGSPHTIANLMINPVCEINIVDYFARKGYIFKGCAEILTEGELFDQIHESITKNRSGRAFPSKRYVLIHIAEVSQVISPGYAAGQSEAEMKQQWSNYWESVQLENS